MTSAIDATKPVFGTPTTASVRANFTAAKAEIEALQALMGFADYNDTSTTSSPLALSSSTWTKLPNNGLGAYTKIDALPVGVSALWNASTGQFDFSDCPVNTMIDLRADLSVTTSAANQILRLKADLAIGHASAFSLERTQVQFKTAGTYHVVSDGGFYIGSAPIAANPAELKIWSDATATVVVNGWYIRMIKFPG